MPCARHLPAQAGFPILPRLLTAASAATAFLAAAFAWNLRSSVKELKKGGVVAPSWISGNLLRCNALNIIGLFASVLAVQAALGEPGLGGARDYRLCRTQLGSSQ